MTVGGPSPEGSVRRVLPRALFVFGVLFVILLVLAGVLLDRIATAFVNRTLASSVAAPASVGKIRISIPARVIDVIDLRILNPPGFEHPDLLVLPTARLEFELSSLFSREVVIKTIHASGLTVHVERSGGRDNMKEAFPPKPRGAPSDTDSGKRFKIRRLVLTDAKVTLPVLGVEREIAVDSLSIDDPLGKGTGALVGDVVEQVANRVIASAGRAAGKTIEGAGKELGAAAEAVGDAVKSLFK